jgi:hypothetical protein
LQIIRRIGAVAAGLRNYPSTDIYNDAIIELNLNYLGLAEKVFWWGQGIGNRE